MFIYLLSISCVVSFSVTKCSAFNSGGNNGKWILVLMVAGGGLVQLFILYAHEIIISSFTFKKLTKHISDFPLKLQFQ